MYKWLKNAHRKNRFEKGDTVVQFSIYRITGNIGGPKIWWICHKRHLVGSKLADFESQTDDITKWWLHYEVLGLEPSPDCFRHCKVPSSPGRTIFTAYLPVFNCLVFSGIVGIGAMSHTTLRANPLLSQQKFASHARSPVLSPSLRECHTWAQALPSAVTLAGPNWLQRTHTIMEYFVATQCYHASNSAVVLQEEGYRKMCCAREQWCAWAPCAATGISKIHYSIPAFSPHCQALANSRIRLQLSKSRCPCRHDSLELLFAWSIWKWPFQWGMPFTIIFRLKI